jgi:hypothetical protein
MKLSVPLILYELSKGPNPPAVFSRSLLEEHTAVPVGGLTEEHTAVSGIRLLDRGPFQDDVLYISQPEWILSRRDGEEAVLPAQLFVAGVPNGGEDRGAVWIDLPLNELVNAVEAVFYQYNRIDAELNEAVARNDPLRTILSLCARFFNNPVTISDLRMRFIETSDNAVRDLMPDYFKVVIDTGYIDIRIIQSMKKRGYDKLQNECSSTLLYDLDDIPVRFFSKNIYDGVHITACVVIHEVFCPIDRAQTIIVDQITQLIDTYAFKSQRGKATSMTRVEQIIDDLMNGSKYDDDIHAPALKQINWGVSDGYYLIKILVSAGNVTTSTAKYTFASAQSFFPGSLIVEKDDSAVLVICTAKIQYDFENALSKLEKYLEDRQDFAAVSRRFQSISALYVHYTAATYTLQLGPILEPERHLFFFQDYTVPLMLKLCGRDIDIRVFCMQEAITLYEYDKENHSEFFRSLYVYLRHNRSLANAAKEMKIHRNTLLYRIGRAAEIAKLDPADENIQLPMILSYDIMSYRLKLEDTGY